MGGSMSNRAALPPPIPLVTRSNKGNHNYSSAQRNTESSHHPHVTIINQLSSRLIVDKVSAVGQPSLYLSTPT